MHFYSATSSLSMLLSHVFEKTEYWYFKVCSVFFQIMHVQKEIIIWVMTLFEILQQENQNTILDTFKYWNDNTLLKIVYESF